MAPSGGAPNTPPNGPPPSNPQSAPNLVSFDPKLAVPEQPIYLQRNDYIGLFLLSNVTNCTVRFNYRFLTPEGEIKEGSLSIGPFTGTAFQTIEIYEGWLLSFAAIISSAPVAGGWAFLQTTIARGLPTAGGQSTNGVFWQGYLFFGTGIGWPGPTPKDVTDGAGVLRSITGTTPAAGADINEVVPANRRWNLLALSANLATSAAVANRAAFAVIDDGANRFEVGPAFTVQAASLNFGYAFLNGPINAAPIGGNVPLALTLPIPLKSGFRIKTSTNNLQAGDQWTAPQYLVQEWGLWDS